MGRKGRQLRNGMDHHQSSNNRNKASDPGDEAPVKKTTHEPVIHTVEHEPVTHTVEHEPVTNEAQYLDESSSSTWSSFWDSCNSHGHPPGAGEEHKNVLHGNKRFSDKLIFVLSHLHIKYVKGGMDVSNNALFVKLKRSVFYGLMVASRWRRELRLLHLSMVASMHSSLSRVRLKAWSSYLLKWLKYFWSTVLLISTVWLACTLRGISSFLRLGTSTFVSVFWCCIFSIISVVGIARFFIFSLLVIFITVLIGAGIGILVVLMAGIVFLWSCGRFWTTMAAAIVVAGLALKLRHDRLAILLTTLYSIHCVWKCTGWSGLLLALNVSFVSSDILLCFAKINVDQKRSSKNPRKFGGHETEAGPSMDDHHDPAAMASSSSFDSELGFEDEVVRLLNCNDHYSALGLSRYENVDVSVLKREYRRKAMLVHPDKNMGNAKAAEAFKILQNAYEVLIDSMKRRTYDDELRREDFLNCFRRFQGKTSKREEENGLFARTEVEEGEPFGDSRRVSCRKCSSFHRWIPVKKDKSRARWCQDCKDFHSAKDGEGWLEQTLQPLMFGFLQKVKVPTAYICANGMIYDVSEWYLCQNQGRRCAANTHRASFHVNAGFAGKHSNGSEEEEMMSHEAFGSGSPHFSDDSSFQSHRNKRKKKGKQNR